MFFDAGHRFHARKRANDDHKEIDVRAFASALVRPLLGNGGRDGARRFLSRRHVRRICFPASPPGWFLVVTGIVQRNVITAVSLVALTLLIFVWPQPPTGHGIPRAVLSLGVSAPIPQARLPVEAEPLAAPSPRLASLPLSTRAGVPTAETVLATFERLGYDFALVRAGALEVPPVYLQAMPADMGDLQEPEMRKRIFFKTVLPLILRVNEDIRADRHRVSYIRQLIDAGRYVSGADRQWLARLMGRYDVADGDVDELLQRLDVIPPSLALAQAAEESGWGTSRFAREGNALFGQYTTATDGHLVPTGLEDRPGIRVQAFNRLLDSVHAYALNLNTHSAYRRFRNVRAAMRTEGTTIDGMQLAQTLDRYSARGDAYVRTILSLIRGNRLSALDGARLAEGNKQNGFDA